MATQTNLNPEQFNASRALMHAGVPFEISWTVAGKLPRKLADTLARELYRARLANLDYVTAIVTRLANETLPELESRLEAVRQAAAAAASLIRERSDR